MEIMNKSKKLYNGQQKAKQRRVSTIERLELQLKSGTKTEKVSHLTLSTTGANQIPLEEQDVKRIKRELSILKTRI